jgi:uncharacterized glyoxalase superfamily protein PhnB
MDIDTTKPTIYPALRYADAVGAISFLTTAFGLVEHQVHKGEGGDIAHAELAWHGGMVMLSSRGPEPGPFDTERVCLYLVVDDPDAHHARAVAAGVQIVMPLTDQDYGSREYAAADPEGNVWCFGTYQPSTG